ncbi:MAG TPA: glutamate synthase large subunit [Chloroflexota bacterium]|nr:glutamate synthase large subunit [Chloroflexota bacterium]
MESDHRRGDYSHTLYDPSLEHDACGTGFVADVSGRPSHRVVELAIESVVNLTHRGAVSADAKTGDGAGILTPLPRRLLVEEAARLGRSIEADRVAVGMLFLPADPNARTRARAIVEAALADEQLPVVFWRDVPVDASCLGDKAFASQPTIEQVIIGQPAGLDALAFERALYHARKAIERAASAEQLAGLYIPSFSSRTVAYKGLFVAPQLGRFYLDLQNSAYEAALAVFHQRYSTNTFPTWSLAQPFRLLAHNGEINTVQGNQNWMRAREPELSSPVWGDKLGDLTPIIWEDASDSSRLDNVLELIELSGRDVLHGMMMLIPEAWENMPDVDPDLRAFYEYHACLTEPWDGPAALAFSDGTIAGAVLDRNGLRPARYVVTDDNLVIMASEFGVVELDPAHVVEKGRLGPGQMIAVNTATHEILRNDELKQRYVRRQPYGEWIRNNMVRMADHVVQTSEDRANSRDSGDDSSLPGGVDELTLYRQQQAFGFGNEELKFVLEPMGVEGKEPVWSMGDDTPPAVLSRKGRPLPHYFRQRFAEVSNPPIDPLRESIVMSLDCYLGHRRSMLLETPEHARLLHLKSPLLDNDALEAIAQSENPDFSSVTIPALFDAHRGLEGLEDALDLICADAVRAVDAGKTILIVSDRGVDGDHAPIPIVLAIAAIHHHLIRQGRRLKADLLVESGQVWDVHHFALLLGYGASAINPYLAIESIAALVADVDDNMSFEAAYHNFEKAIRDALLKIMSKMGISPLASYRGAQIFEIVGLDRDLVARCFPGTPSRIRGIGLAEIADDTLARHAAAFAPVNGKPRLPDSGLYRFRKDGEYHAYNPFAVRALQKAANSGQYADYKVYAELLRNREPAVLRDLLRFKDRPSVPLDEVESVESIRRRFTTQAMSLGALSPEAHQTISIAMNRIGSRSNTGEGGEDPSWYRWAGGGDSPDNKTKQVASARFGVTAEYLAHAQELEIKMAQGSKPGEGGQLPAHKVSPMIARFRHAIPGIPLISPPPHHDIYSIEDLAQLIYDLKQANPRAKVGVKLVSESGVGTIAAGVAKAYADYILISGQDGGTGASPLSSIKNAGCPWELGLSETQQVLVLNDLRGRVVLRVDGGFKTGRDVVVGAMLGAEEFGFGTASVVSIGCDMARQCHLNTCPTGIATQREDLRQKFTGRPEQLINFLTLVAEEVREILASLGFRRLDEIVGRVDLLESVPDRTGRHATLDLSQIIADVDPSGARPRQHNQERNNRADTPLDDTILADAASAIDRQGTVQLRYPIRNSNRTLGGRLSGEIAHRHGIEGLPDGAISIAFEGSAGQSFGAWCVNGVHLTLDGDANDYVGKGMSGGEIVIRPPANATFSWKDNVIIGNTVLYGATGGRFFVAGRAGERFGVRNSGALAVVEGCGDHGCEYMTAGTVVVLGPTGRNFAAGMSAGIAYVLDENDAFIRKCNRELVSVDRITAYADAQFLRDVIAEHQAKTGSPWAQHLLDNFEWYQPLFWKVVPHPPVVKTEGKDAHGVVAVVHAHGHNGHVANGTNGATVPVPSTNGRTDDQPERAPAH